MFEICLTFTFYQFFVQLLIHIFTSFCSSLKIRLLFNFKSTYNRLLIDFRSIFSSSRKVRKNWVVEVEEDGVGEPNPGEVLAEVAAQDVPLRDRILKLEKKQNYILDLQRKWNKERVLATDNRVTRGLFSRGFRFDPHETILRNVKQC